MNATPATASIPNSPPARDPRAGMPAAAPRPAAGPSVPMIGGGRLPLAFIVSGLVALAVAAATLALRPSLLLEAHVHPYVVALAHAWLPGFLLSVCMGAMYQLTPVILGTALRGGAIAPWVHLGLHTSGVILLVTGFVLGHFGLVAVGGTIITIGIVLLVQSVMRTFAASRRRDAIAWCFPLAAGWLAVTVLAGVLMAVSRHWSVWGLSPFGWLRAHAHLGLVGFFLTLLQGATFQLFPMFTMGEARRPRCIAGGLAGTQVGLLLLAVGLAGEWPVFTMAGAASAIVGVVLSGVAFVATAKTRRRLELEPALRGFVAGIALLAVGAIAGAVLVALPAGPGVFRGATAYGVLVIAGGLGLTVMGMLGKIIPFLVWMRRYGPRIGREQVPLATMLSSRSLERVWLAAHVSGVVVLAAAAVAESAAMAVVGAIALGIAVGAFLGNAGRVLAHLWRPLRELPPRPAAAPAASLS